MIANAERYDWSPDDLLPGVLRFYDLPELATSLGKPVLIINPRDALYLPLTQRDATQLYSSGKSSNNVSVRSEVEPGEGRALQIRWVAEWPRRPAPAR